MKLFPVLVGSAMAATMTKTLYTDDACTVIASDDEAWCADQRDCSNWAGQEATHACNLDANNCVMMITYMGDDKVTTCESERDADVDKDTCKELSADTSYMMKVYDCSAPDPVVTDAPTDPQPVVTDAPVTAAPTDPQPVPVVSDAPTVDPNPETPAAEPTAEPTKEDKSAAAILSTIASVVASILALF